MIPLHRVGVQYPQWRHRTVACTMFQGMTSLGSTWLV